MTRHERDSGFTLVELLIVMAVIGLLAAIVVPQFNASREKAFINTLRADLRNLSSLQEIHHGNQMSYTNDVAVLNFQPSDGVTATFVESTNVGWSATVSHAGAPGESCAVFHGEAAAVAPATIVGVIACTSN